MATIHLTEVENTAEIAADGSLSVSGLLNSVDHTRYSPYNVLTVLNLSDYDIEVIFENVNGSKKRTIPAGMAFEISERDKLLFYNIFIHNRNIVYAIPVSKIVIAISKVTCDYPIPRGEF